MKIIGIHTPEFAFEKKKENVEDAMKEFGLDFPVVLDNKYATWNAYKNSFWPRKYIVDIEGNVVYDHIGEGDYKETEEKIQELLKERDKKLGIKQDYPALEGEISTTKSESDITPETYLGSDRSERKVTGVPKRHEYVLKGSWKVEKESITAMSDKDRLEFNVHAKTIYVVAGDHAFIDVDIYVDNIFSKTIPMGRAKLVTVFSDTSVKEHLISLRPKKSGLSLFAFTFGS